MNTPAASATLSRFSRRQNSSNGDRAAIARRLGLQIGPGPPRDRSTAPVLKAKEVADGACRNLRWFAEERTRPLLMRHRANGYR